MSSTGEHLAHDWYPRALPANVVIGKRSWLYSSYAFLHYQSTQPVGVRIGNDTGVYNGTFFELGPEGQVEIGDFCAIVGAIINTNRRVEIHDYAFVAHEVFICDTTVAVPPGSRAVVSNAGPSSPIVIGENAWIGARAVLTEGASLGEGAIVGAGSVVRTAVPPHATVAGNPARIVGRAP